MTKLVQLTYEKLSVNAYLNPELCTKCGGACCKNLPGTAWPEQFGAPNREMLLTNLIKAFRSQMWAVDCWEGWEGYGKGKYVRPATLNAPGRLIDYSWGGVCVFLVPTGCILSIENRPLGCKLLVPSKNFPNCNYKDLPGNGKFEGAKAWEPYHVVLTAAIEQVLEKPNAS